MIGAAVGCFTSFCRASPNDFSADCAGVRRRAYSILNTDIALDHVGRYGNSDPTNISQWLRILNETFEANNEVCTFTSSLSILTSFLGFFALPLHRSTHHFGCNDSLF